jgi:hypothetical protein
MPEIYTFQNDAIEIEPFRLVTYAYGVIGLATDPTTPILGVTGPLGAYPNQPDAEVIVYGIAPVATQQGFPGATWLTCSASGTVDVASPLGGQTLVGRSLERSRNAFDVIDIFINPTWI